jgi:hypothetical protein
MIYHKKHSDTRAYDFLNQPELPEQATSIFAIALYINALPKKALMISQPIHIEYRPTSLINRFIDSREIHTSWPSCVAHERP